METGFYYVSSRYYDAQIGRFINLDSYISTGQGILGYNMFAYCLNNPVCRKDVLGTTSAEIFDNEFDPTDDDKDINGGKMGNNSNMPGKGVGNKGGSNSWTRNLKNTADLNVEDFKTLENNGVVEVNKSGSNRPLTGNPNSYYTTVSGNHVFVYDENGKLIYDLSSYRVKSFIINIAPNGVEYYQPYKLNGAVPNAIKELFRW